MLSEARITLCSHDTGSPCSALEPVFHATIATQHAVCFCMAFCCSICRSHHLCLLVSYRDTAGCIHMHEVCLPLAGDLMTALLLAHLHKDPGNLQRAVEQALASLQALLAASAEAAGDAAHSKERTAQVSLDYYSLHVQAVQACQQEYCSRQPICISPA